MVKASVESFDYLSASGRKKRFVLNPKITGNVWWSDEKMFTLTYFLSSVAEQNGEYKERIEVAVEDLNHLGLLKLTPSEAEMGFYQLNCPLDTYYIKTKYQNPIMFDLFEENEPGLVCVTVPQPSDNIYKLLYLTGNENDTEVRLAPFAKIICNPYHSEFKHIGSGVIIHEVMHILGIGHPHVLNETNHLLTIHWDKLTTQKYSEYFKSVIVPPSIKYGLASPFSIMHYAESELFPLKRFNQTAIETLLDEYQFSEIVKNDYYDLLEKYAGRVNLLTYQDLLSLLVAVKTIAPKSLIRKRIHLPGYYLLNGIYRPTIEAEKLGEVIQKIKEAEGFIYPVFAKNNITLVMRLSHNTRDLIQEAEAISVNGALHCQLGTLSLHDPASTLELGEDCFLTSFFEKPGMSSFRLWFINSNNSTAEVIVSLEVRKFFSKLLLGKPNTEYKIQTNFTPLTIDLIQACQVVTYPAGELLSCAFTEDFQDNRLNLSLCQLNFDFREENIPTNVSILFLHENVNKTCTIDFSLANESVQMPSFLTGRTFASAYYHRGEKYLNESGSTVLRNKQSLQLFNHLLLLPFLQGIFEAGIDGYITSIRLQSLAKLTFRLALIFFSTGSFMRMGILSLVSGFEICLKEWIQGKNKTLERLLFGAMFLILAEMEYAFFDLWYLAGKPIFFASLIEKLNGVFGNQVVGPGCKTMGYLLAIELGKVFSTKKMKPERYVEGGLQSGIPLLDLSGETNSANRPLSFFAATKNAAQVVFSKKIGKAIPFFRPLAAKQKNLYFSDTSQLSRE